MDFKVGTRRERTYREPNPQDKAAALVVQRSPGAIPEEPSFDQPEWSTTKMTAVRGGATTSKTVLVDACFGTTKVAGGGAKTSETSLVGARFKANICQGEWQQQPGSSRELRSKRRLFSLHGETSRSPTTPTINPLDSPQEIPNSLKLILGKQLELQLIRAGRASMTSGVRLDHLPPILHRPNVRAALDELSSPPALAYIDLVVSPGHNEGIDECTFAYPGFGTLNPRYQQDLKHSATPADGASPLLLYPSSRIPGWIQSALDTVLAFARVRLPPHLSGCVVVQVQFTRSGPFTTRTLHYWRTRRTSTTGLTSVPSWTP